jgi:transposase
MTYSLDFRRKVLSTREAEGLTISEVAGRFCVGVASVVRWVKRLEPCTSRYKPATRIDRIALARDVREHPDAYQAERAARLGGSVRGIGHALHRMGTTYKKKSAASQGK